MTSKPASKTKKLKVAVVSSKSRFCDIDANLKHFAALVRKARQQQARFVCFPELSLTGYTLRKEILEIAQPVPGPATEVLEKIAADNQAFLSVGLAEKSRNKYHITQVLIGPRGYIGKYRKMVVTDGEFKAGFSNGHAYSTYDIDGFNVGINICYDGRHRKTINAMKKAGVDIILHPHGNYLNHGTHAEIWTRGKLSYLAERAIYARAYILINNSAGDMPHPGGITGFGSGALVIDPLGQAVARTTQRTRSEKMVVTTLIKPLNQLIPDFEITRFND